ncbi:uncharacterized protein PFL1_01206 [Pseudozyma flocculosa PF-1]|uniref:uncharacterized protein n=1 Tax=Pseudozyma flocculosa PF-1 TaxID=1277687 RepID=UPI0004561BFF|nr:uncharacterized protein PFL1_01206 [Pseudozyma flocculosa PF-1]EPQ31017.1 hypothetical protein PFL1_01206 [Pseudozyma flocculosa PF-1]
MDRASRHPFPSSPRPGVGTGADEDPSDPRSPGQAAPAPAKPRDLTPRPHPTQRVPLSSGTAAAESKRPSEARQVQPAPEAVKLASTSSVKRLKRLGETARSRSSPAKPGAGLILAEASPSPASPTRARSHPLLWPRPARDAPHVREGEPGPPLPPPPQRSPVHGPTLLPGTVADPLGPPQTLLEALGAADAAEQSRAGSSGESRRKGVVSSPPLPQAPRSPFAATQDESVGGDWTPSTALPSSRHLDEGASASHHGRPSILKRRSWKKLHPRSRSASIDALHSLTSLPGISSFKSLTSLHKGDQTTKEGSVPATPVSNLSTAPATPSVEGAASSSAWSLSSSPDDYFRGGAKSKPGAPKQRMATDQGRLLQTAAAAAAAPPTKAIIRDRHGQPVRSPCKLLSHDDPALQDWESFVRAYANGQLDLNAPLPAPSKGRPDPSVVPSGPASPSEGPMLAPRPGWETERQRSLHRLRIEEMPQERWIKIQEICDELQRRTQCRESMFVVVENDVVHLWCSGSEFFPPGVYPRGHLLCSHTILNRNEGLIIPDLSKDWRTSNNPLLEGVRYYAAMPVCTAEGVPLGALCCLSSEPRSGMEECEGDRALLAEFSVAIAAELESWAAECFRRKVDAIEQGWWKLERHLRERGEVRPGARIAPPSDLLDPSRFPPPSPTDPRKIAGLGLTATRRDIADIEFCTSIIADAIDLEVVYVVAVASPADRCSLIGSHGLPGPIERLNPDLYLKALHAHEGGLVYENAARFETDLGGTDGTSDDGDARRQDGKFQAAVFCPIFFNLPDGRAASELSTIFEGHTPPVSRDTPAPVPSSTSNVAIRRCSILSTEAGASIGFVLAALTRSRRRVVGVEDLRYLQGFADVIGALWKKCLPSATTPGPGEAADEAAGIAAARAQELSRKSRQPSYIAASKKAMRVTGDGLTALMKGMHLSTSRSSSDLGSEGGKRPRLRCQRTLGSTESQMSTSSESTAAAEAEPEVASAVSSGGKGGDGPRSRTASTASSSALGSPAFRPTAAPVTMTTAEVASLPALCQLPSTDVADPFLTAQPMGALPDRGLLPPPRRSRPRASARSASPS